MKSLKSGIKRGMRALALPLARMVARNRTVKRLARRLFDRNPFLQRCFDALIGRAAPLPPRRMHVPQGNADLSPATRAAYEELKRHLGVENR